MFAFQKKSVYTQHNLCKDNILQFITCKPNIKSFAKYQTINKHSTFNLIHFYCYRKYQHFRQDYELKCNSFVGGGGGGSIARIRKSINKNL